MDNATFRALVRAFRPRHSPFRRRREQLTIAANCAALPLITKPIVHQRHQPPPLFPDIHAPFNTFTQPIGVPILLLCPLHHHGSINRPDLHRNHHSPVRSGHTHKYHSRFHRSPLSVSVLSTLHFNCSTAFAVLASPAITFASINFTIRVYSPLPFHSSSLLSAAFAIPTYRPFHSGYRHFSASLPSVLLYSHHLFP